MTEDDDALNVWLVGCWCWVLVSTVWDVSRLVVLSSLCPGQTWHLQLRPSQHTGGGERVVKETLHSQRCPGPRQHHLLRFGPDAVHHACCSNRHILNCLSLLSPTTSMMYSLQWRERGRRCAWADWCSLWFSLYSHTLHYTPLNSTPVYSSHIIWVRPEWSCMLGLAGPHYSHLSSCKHCNWEMIYPIRVQQSHSVLQSILCWPIKSS